MTNVTLVPQISTRFGLPAILAGHTRLDVRAECPGTCGCKTRNLLVRMAERFRVEAALELDVRVLELWSVFDFRFKAHQVLMYALRALVVTDLNA